MATFSLASWFVVFVTHASTPNGFRVKSACILHTRRSERKHVSMDFACICDPPRQKPTKIYSPVRVFAACRSLARLLGTGERADLDRMANLSIRWRLSRHFLAAEASSSSVCLQNPLNEHRKPLIYKEYLQGHSARPIQDRAHRAPAGRIRAQLICWIRGAAPGSSAC